ncbi:ABC-type Mn2+/Zn2+ transport system permease subunit [Ewingella americana]
MIELLLQPFHYNYMVKAIWVSAGVGAVCAFLSAYLMLKGWSLMGDALSHSVVPGVAGAYALGFPYAIGAFGTGILAALSMTLLRHYTRLREDAIIGFVFSSFFALGLLLVSLNPTSVNVQSILFGNILGIDDADILQVQIIVGVSLLVLCVIWRDLLAVFFDEAHARSVGLSRAVA